MSCRKEGMGHRIKTAQKPSRNGTICEILEQNILPLPTIELLHPHWQTQPCPTSNEEKALGEKPNNFWAKQSPRISRRCDQVWDTLKQE
jgi:hypothetical protein